MYKVKTRDWPGRVETGERFEEVCQRRPLLERKRVVQQNDKILYHSTGEAYRDVQKSLTKFRSYAMTYRHADKLKLNGIELFARLNAESDGTESESCSQPTDVILANLNCNGHQWLPRVKKPANILPTDAAHTVLEDTPRHHTGKVCGQLISRGGL